MTPLRPEDQVEVTPHGNAPDGGPAVVVHLSDKPEGHAALDWAVEFASQNEAIASGTRPTLHVVLSGGDREASKTFFSPTTMEKVEGTLRASGLAHQIHEPTDDSVGQILDLADELETLLIVTGVVRRSAAMKLILGSHTQRLLLQADCPVVAVKATES